MVENKPTEPAKQQDKAEGVRLAPNAAPGKLIPAAAKRALQEAEERRKAADAKTDSDSPEEIAGPKGSEPTRYGDWERGGIAYDF